MDKKKIVIAALIVIIAILATFIAYQTLIPQEKDIVINIDNITFNTTNGTDFKLYNQTSGWKIYGSDNCTGRYTVQIVDYNKLEAAGLVKAQVLNIKDYPSQTVDGVVVYSDTAKIGDHVGEPRYVAIVENMNINTDVILTSPDPNETAKMALSLKFNK